VGNNVTRGVLVRFRLLYTHNPNEPVESGEPLSQSQLSASNQTTVDHVHYRRVAYTRARTHTDTRTRTQTHSRACARPVALVHVGYIVLVFLPSNPPPCPPNSWPRLVETTCAHSASFTRQSATGIAVRCTDRCARPQAAHRRCTSVAQPASDPHHRSDGGA